MTDVEEFEEWRVTGDPGQPFPRYDFTWSPDRGHPDPEAAARAFVAKIRDSHHQDWIDGPHLSMRKVSRTGWRSIDTVPEDPPTTK